MVITAFQRTVIQIESWHRSSTLNSLCFGSLLLCFLTALHVRPGHSKCFSFKISKKKIVASQNDDHCRGHENASEHIIGKHMNKLTAFTSESTQRLFNTTSTFAQSNYKYIIRLADKNCNLCGINHKRRGGENNRVSKSLPLELEL